ncbi:unnamed protein product, partial [Amoebophrya sp. A25]
HGCKSAFGRDARSSFCARPFVAAAHFSRWGKRISLRRRFSGRPAVLSRRGSKT